MLRRLPNALSVSRVLLSMFLLLCMASHSWTASLVLFIVSAVTDAIDGPLARKLMVTSRLGGQLDRVGDLSLLIAATAGFAISRTVPVSLVLEFSVSFIASLIYIRLTRRTKRPTEHDEFTLAIGALAFSTILLIIALYLTYLAFGWRLWQLPTALTIVALGGYAKRGRVSAILDRQA